ADGPAAGLHPGVPDLHRGHRAGDLVPRAGLSPRPAGARVPLGRTPPGEGDPAPEKDWLTPSGRWARSQEASEREIDCAVREEMNGEGGGVPLAGPVCSCFWRDQLLTSLHASSWPGAGWP